MIEELPTLASATGSLSRAAKERMLSRRCEPLFLADWVDTLMVHLEVDPVALQHATPFPIDLFDGHAFVSLVFFTMRRMRPRLGGPLTEWLMRPIATHEFLNVRTYVKCDDEPGIHFLAEWLPNRLSVHLGSTPFGLPYRLGRVSYRHAPNGTHALEGKVVDIASNTALTYHGQFTTGDHFVPCPAGSLDEWLMERYTAFTHHRGASRLFRVWHPPWPQASAGVELVNDSLLRLRWPWLADGTVVGANYSPGFRDVWMGRPQRLR